MNDERIGRDMDINPDMTYRNVWMEGNSGDDVVQIVQAKIDEINRIKEKMGNES